VGYCFIGQRFARVIRCTADMTACIATFVSAGNNSHIKGLLSFVFAFVCEKVHGFSSVFASTYLCEKNSF
jgi:hypothetical protein